MSLIRNFVAANGPVPTDTARQLDPEIRVGLEVIEAAVAGASHFDPATSNRTFRILATDLGEIALLPSVLAELETRAPRVRIEVVPLDTATAGAQLQRGRADAVICTPRLEDPDLRRDVLVREHYVGLCAKDHPGITDKPTLAAYLGERHLSVDAAAGHSQAEQVLSSLGLRCEVGLRVSHFAALPHLLERTRYLAMVPCASAQWSLRAANVRIFTLPVDVPEVEVSSTPTTAGPLHRRSTGYGRSSALSANSSSDPASASGRKRDPSTTVGLAPPVAAEK